MSGGLGADLLYGGGGADLFVIVQASGNDTIADFDGAGSDRVAVAALNTNGSLIDTFVELSAAAKDTGDGNLEIALGTGNVLTLLGVKVADLQSDWFVFT